MNNSFANLSNFLLAIVGIITCFMLPAVIASPLAIIIIAFHLRIIKPYEWRLLIQLSVLGWVVDAIFIRMHWLQLLDDVTILPRILSWTLLATMLCHALYPIMKRLSTAMLFGVFWGWVAYLLPVVVSAQYLSVLSWPLLSLSAAISGMLLLLLAAFIIKTRIFSTATV